jgi:hypothetical protein
MEGVWEHLQCCYWGRVDVLLAGLLGSLQGKGRELRPETLVSSPHFDNLTCDVLSLLQASVQNGHPSLV